MLIAVLIDVAVPLAVYYAARASGASQWLALVLSATAPLMRAAYTLVRNRAVDGFAVAVLGVILVSVAASFVTGGPRFLLAKDGWLTAVVGIVILTTVRTRRPLMFVVGRAMLEKVGESADDWDRRWDHSPEFRRVWRALTVAWGVGVILDAAIVVVIAYVLPIDLVPGISALQWIALLVVLNAGSQVYLRRPAVRPLIFD